MIRRLSVCYRGSIQSVRFFLLRQGSELSDHGTFPVRTTCWMSSLTKIELTQTLRSQPDRSLKAYGLLRPQTPSFREGLTPPYENPGPGSRLGRQRRNVTRYSSLDPKP